jgi:hypothetical protein
MNSNVHKLVFVSLGIFCCVTAFASSADQKKYIKLNLPQVFGYPVYVFKGNKQVAYYSNAKQSVFLQAESNQSATYTLYQQKNAVWQGCSITFSGETIDKATTCLGAVINSQPIGNEAVLTLGTKPNMQQKGAPTGIHKPDNKRTITFINNTKYYNIQVGEACTIASNPGNPDCKNTQDLFQLTQHQSTTITIGKEGLKSFSFIMTGYQAKKGDKMTVTGGYNGEGKGHPYASKFEGTFAPLTNGFYIDSNIDASLVDGFNIGFKMYPDNPTYATYTCLDATDSKQLQCVGYFSKDDPMSTFIPSTSESLSAICNSATGDQHGQEDLMNLVQTDPNTGKFQGCYSACTNARATANQAEINHYCCPTGNSAECRSNGYAASAKYVTTTHQYSERTYAYSYDDKMGDYGTNGNVNFTVEFIG